MRTKFCLEILKGRDHSEDLRVNGRIGEQDCRVWIGFVWLGIGTGGGLL
jgi:hypothetical protein